MKGKALLPGNKALTEFLELHVWSPNHSMTRVRGTPTKKMRVLRWACQTGVQSQSDEQPLANPASARLYFFVVVQYNWFSSREQSLEEEWQPCCGFAKLYTGDNQTRFSGEKNQLFMA